MFLGFSTVHSSLVPLVLNTRTGRISLQYHIIFDNKFETVESLPTDISPDKIWLNLLQLHCDFFLNKEFDTNGNMKLSHLPDLDKDWLSEDLTSPVQSIPLCCSPCHTSAHDWTLVPGGALAPGGAGCCHSPQTTQHSHPMSGSCLSHKTSSPDANRLDPA